MMSWMSLVLVYKPSEETLLQIDRFCLSIIAECDMTTNRKLAPLSRPLSQQSGASAASTTVSPLPVSSFACDGSCSIGKRTHNRHGHHWSNNHSHGILHCTVG
nr:uncharacterized protein LOC109186744 [Ipomoea batatas]GMC65589.1 uncharacterized protein LOC109186744 [Ipomoea batatas]